MAAYLSDFDSFIRTTEELSIPDLAALYNTDSLSREWLNDPELLRSLVYTWDIPTGEEYPEIRSFKDFLREYYVKYLSLEALDYFPFDFYTKYLHEDGHLGEFLVLLLAEIGEAEYLSMVHKILQSYPDVAREKVVIDAANKTVSSALQTWNRDMLLVLLPLATGKTKFAIFKTAITMGDLDLVQNIVKVGMTRNGLTIGINHAQKYGKNAYASLNMVFDPRRRAEFHRRMEEYRDITDYLIRQRNVGNFVEPSERG